MVLTRQLEQRGYDKNLIDKIFMMVLRLDRDNLIEYKVNFFLKFEDKFILKFNFDRNI